MSKIIKKTILTEDDLLKFCQDKKFARFNSKDIGYQLALKVPTTFEVDDIVDDNHRGMMRLKFRIFHTGLNRNKSYVSKESAEKAMYTIADRPVLAAIHQLDDGTWDFEGHEMEIIKNDKGNEELRYIESQVGSFSSEPAFWEHDNELNKDYVCAYAYISEEYTKACEIIRSKQGTKNSCELFIDDLSYNAKEKYLELNDFYVNASTLLGSRDDGTEIQEGMEGSRADIADFSVENNSVKFNKEEKLIELLENLNKTLSNFNKKERIAVQEKITKGGTELNKEHFEEEVTENEEVTETEESEEEVTTTEEESEETVEETSEEDPKTTEPVEDGQEEPEQAVEEETEDTTTEGSEVESFSKDELFNKLFDISFEDIRYALNALCSIYRNDSEWCYVSQVYDEYFIMQDWDSDKYYKQSYTREDDNIALTGERTEMFAMLLTESEKISIEEMRSNYAELKAFKEEVELNELREQKKAILDSEKYEILAQKDEEGKFVNKDYEKLVSEMDNYSLADLETEIKVLHSDYVSEHGNFELSKPEKKETTTKKQFVSVNKKAAKPSRYGKLFAKEEK